jgi:hypothetical protein
MLRAAILSLVVLASCSVAMTGTDRANAPSESPAGSVGDAQSPAAPTSSAPPAPSPAAEAPAAKPYDYWWHVTGKSADAVLFPGAPFRTDVAFLYEHDAGQYPRIYKGREEHGGVPQRANLSAHLAELARDIQRDIPDLNFSGWAVLDYEAWDPVWELTKPEYREASKEIVRRNSPGRPDADVERLAKANYESGAKRFMLDTLKEAKRLRPKAKWGYYAFPWPSYAVYQQKTQWLWDASDALFPCLYADKQGLPNSAAKIGPLQREVTVYQSDLRGRIALCKRFAPGKPVIALLWVRYDGIGSPIFGQFVNDDDLSAMLTVPKAAGADGAIFWNQAQSPAEATDLNRFVRARLTSEITRANR